MISKSNNLPVVFHCDIGTDRTGVMAYLCGALLGINTEDLERDYLFSNFGNIGGSRSITNFRNVMSALSSYQGSDLAAKTESYLKSIGVWQSEIDAFRNIMLG